MDEILLSLAIRCRAFNLRGAVTILFNIKWSPLYRPLRRRYRYWKYYNRPKWATFKLRNTS